MFPRFRTILRAIKSIIVQSYRLINNKAMESKSLGHSRSLIIQNMSICEAELCTVLNQTAVGLLDILIQARQFFHGANLFCLFFTA